MFNLNAGQARLIPLPGASRLAEHRTVLEAAWKEAANLSLETARGALDSAMVAALGISEQQQQAALALVSGLRAAAEHFANPEQA